MAGTRIRKGDTVQVIAGRREDRNKKGTVLAVLRDSDKVIVEGINRVKRHTRVTEGQRGAKEGGIITKEAPIHISKVMVVDADGKPTRVGVREERGSKTRPDGTSYDTTRRVRVSKRTGKDL